EDAEDEARVVRLRVDVPVAALHVRAGEGRDALDDLFLRLALVLPLPGERVVHGEADAVHPLRHLVARELGEREAERVDEADAFIHQPLALAHGLPGDEELSLSQVAEAAVYELGRAARRARREVL